MSSRFSTCSVDACSQPGARGFSCPTCKQHLCAKHLSRRFHLCPSSSELDDEAWEKSIDDEVKALLSMVNQVALVKKASRLNEQKQCTFQAGKYVGSGAIMGCANYHGWIIFEDGERWMVRIPRTSIFSDIPPELIEYLVESEYATLKFLESTKVPAPKAFAFGLASDSSNPVGVSYLFIEALPGKPFQQDEASEEQNIHVMKQVAAIQSELSMHPFPKAGSLKGGTTADPVIEVSAMASNRFLHLHPLGPFSTAQSYFEGITREYLELIADGQLHHSCSVESYLLYHFFLSGGFRSCIDASSDRVGDLQGQFFLKHVDDKGDHLMVDDEFNIVGIIDWQFARTVPPHEAFGPSLLTADLDALYSGSQAGQPSSKDRTLAGLLRERGEKALAALAEGSDFVRRFQFGIPTGCSSSEARGIVEQLMSGLRRELGHGDPDDSETDGVTLMKKHLMDLEATNRGRKVLSKLRELERVQEGS